MEVYLQSNPSLLADKIVELEEKVEFILNFLKIPANTKFKKSNLTNQDFGGAPSTSSAKKKEHPGPYTRSVELKTGQDNPELSIKQPEVGQEWVGGGQGDFQCQVCGIRYLTKLKLDYHKMKLKHRHRPRPLQNQLKNEEILIETGNLNDQTNTKEDLDFHDDLDDNENDPTSPPASPLDADYSPEESCNDQSETSEQDKDKVSKKIVRRRRKPEVENNEECNQNGKEGNFKCLVCGMRFLTRKKCDYHKYKMNHRIRKNHKGKATCEHCGKIMVYGKLHIHLLRHTTEKTFLCSLCGKALKSGDTLRLHMKIVHEQVEGKNFQCKFCQSWHKSERNLKFHYKIHEGKMDEMCPHCGKIYANLKRHIIEVHEKVRAYECHLCPNKFKKKGHLDRHLESHAKGDKRRVKSYHVERPEVYARRKCEKKVERFKGIGGESENGGRALGVTEKRSEGGGTAEIAGGSGMEIEGIEEVKNTADELMVIGITVDAQNDN